MKQVEIYYGKSYQTTFCEVERDLQWYDGVEKKMMLFKGGQLKFKYDFEQQRMLPEVEDLVNTTISFRSDKNKFDKWLKEYSSRFNIDVIKLEENDNSILLDMPDDEYDDFLSELDNQNFEYSQ